MRETLCNKTGSCWNWETDISWNHNATWMIPTSPEKVVCIPKILISDMTDLKDDWFRRACNKWHTKKSDNRIISRFRIEVPDIVVTNPNRSGAACLMQQICYCGVQACHGSDTGLKQNLGSFGWRFITMFHNRLTTNQTSWNRNKWCI